MRRRPGDDGWAIVLITVALAVQLRAAERERVEYGMG